jgi:hypothetical protein
MIDLEIQLMSEDPARLTVLQAYEVETAKLLSQPNADVENVAADANAESDRDETQPLVSTDGQSVEEPAVVPQRRAPLWLSRITAIDGIDPPALSKIHGQLIAYGLLKCDLADRSSGVVYQLTSTAKKVLSHLRVSSSGMPTDDSQDDASHVMPEAA